jgi:hypothetical protein
MTNTLGQRAAHPLGGATAAQPLNFQFTQTVNQLTVTFSPLSVSNN